MKSATKNTLPTAVKLFVLLLALAVFFVASPASAMLNPGIGAPKLLSRNSLAPEGETAEMTEVHTPPQDIPANVEASIISQIEAAEYGLSPVENGYEAFNNANDLQLLFNADGVNILHESSNNSSLNWSMKMSLIGYGYKDHLQTPSHPHLEVTENRIEYQHGNLTEWYVNNTQGLEQGFTLTEPLAAGRSQNLPLQVKLSLDTSLIPSLADDGQSLRFTAASGKTIFHYDKLYVFDATGRELPAHLTLANNATLQIVVDDRQAVYPITIDPTVYTEVKFVVPYNTTARWFGYSVAVDGNTAVIGVPEDSLGASRRTGSVYIFEKSGGNWSQAARLVAGDGRFDDRFGWSVAITGTTVLVGAPEDDDNGGQSGTVYVFEKGAGWSDGSGNLLAKLSGSDTSGDDRFGWSVAISGTTAVIGARTEDSPNNSGAAYIFEKGAGWSNDSANQVAKLKASDAAGNDQFGWSVAIDGDTVVVGTPLNDDNGGNSGSAYVFEKGFGGGGVWNSGSTDQAAKLVASDAAGNDQFGYAVAVVSNTVVVGGPFNDDDGGNSGSTYIFEKGFGGGGIWNNGSTDQVAELQASDAAGGDEFGRAVAMSGDTVVIGARGDDPFVQGSTYVFEKGSGWANDSANQVAKLRAGDGGLWDYFGHAVAISGDTVVSGAYNGNGNSDSSGKAYIHEKGAGGGPGWGNNATDQTAKLLPDGASGNNYFDQFGYAVAMSDDTLVVGAPYKEDTPFVGNSGVVYVFERSNGWLGYGNNLVAQLTASNATGGDEFGTSVAIDGDTIVVGARFADPGNQGTVYVFEKGTGWSDGSANQVAIMKASDAQNNDRLGWSVAISGTTIVAGAPEDDDVPNNSGSAYVFEKGVGWPGTETAKLTASDAANNDRFGQAVAVSGDTVVIGAYEKDDVPNNSGAVYVFEKGFGGVGVWNSGSIDQRAKLTTSDAANDDRFGWSVAINGAGDTLVAGARGDDGGAFNWGAVYVFSEGAGWSNSSANQTAKLTADDAQGGDDLGFSVAINGDTVVGGAPYEDGNSGTNRGASYVFQKGSGWVSGNANQVAKLTATDSNDIDEFGYAVALNSQGVVAVGAHFDSEGGSFAGAAYTFVSGVAQVNDGPIYNTLQLAVDAATNGDKVKVIGGVLPDTPFTRGGLTQVGYITKSLTVEGGYDFNFIAADPNNPTIIDPAGAGRGLVISGTVDVDLVNVHLTGGDADNGGTGSAFDNQGGGLAINLADVSLNNSAIYSNTASGGGGGVRVGSTLVVTNGSIISNNTTATNGGGVLVDGGGATSGLLITGGGQIISNTADNNGGGVYITNGGLMTQTSGTLIGYNTADDDSAGGGDGGGVYVNSGNAIWSGGAVSFNAATGNNGGGIYNAAAGIIDAYNLTVEGNSSANGAGIRNQGTATVESSTITNNTGTNAGGGFYNGGQTTLLNVTISGNDSINGAGVNNFSSSGTAQILITNTSIISNNGIGVRTFGGGNTVSLVNTLLANNTTSCAPLSGGTFTAGTDNVLDSGTCDSASVDTAVSNIGPLQNNGGETETHALLFVNPAMNWPAADQNACPTVDQRGENRDGFCDVGAYEAAMPAFQVSKTVNNSTPIPGEVITYTIVIENNTSVGTTNAVISDSLPYVTLDNLTLDPPGAGTVVGLPPTLVSTMTITPNTTITLTVRGTVSTSVLPGQIIVNTTDVLDVSDAATIIIPNADLSVNKFAPSTIDAGDPITYTIWAYNSGPADAEGVVITDTLPANVTFTGIISSNAQLSYTQTTTDEIVISYNGTFTVGELISFELGVVSDSDIPVGTSLENTVEIDADTPDGAPLNNIDTADTSIGDTGADLELVKTATPTAVAGETITYTVVVHNNGPANAENVVIEDTLPVSVTFSNLISTTPAATYSVLDQNVVITAAGTLTAGEWLTFTIVVMVDDAIEPGTSLENVASVSSSTDDPRPINNTGRADTTIVGSADLELTKIGSLNVVAGNEVTYTVTVFNNGPSAAQSVDIKDTLPASVTLDSMYVSGRSGTGTASCVNGLCQVGDMAVGETVTISVVGTVDPAVISGTVLTNQAAVFAVSSDIDDSNNVATHNTAITEAADLTITKIDLRDPVGPTEDFMYQIRVDNTGPSQANNVTITDVLPVSVTYVTSNSADCSHGSGTVTCNAGDLAPGGYASYLITVNVADVISGTLLTNVVTATTSTYNPAGAATDTITTTVQQLFGPAADLDVSKTANPTTTYLGGTLTYTILITNNGPAVATNAGLLDLLPYGASVLNVSVDNPDDTNALCDLSDPSCYLGTMQVNSVATVTARVSVHPENFSGSSLTNEVVVWADQPGSSDTDTATVAIDSSGGSVPACLSRINMEPTIYPRPQDAVDAATNADLIKVAGYCAGVSLRSGITQSVIITKDLTIRGGYTATNWVDSQPDLTPATIDATGLGRVIVITDGVTVDIENIELTGGDAVVGGNGNGGGVYAAIGATLDEFSGNTVYSNSAVNGGAVFVDGSLAISDTVLIVESSLITNNIAITDGGGIWVYGDLLSIDDSEIISNSAGNNGGGAYLESDILLTDASSLEVYDSLIADNTAGNSGGGLWGDNDFYIENSAIIANTAVISDGGGANVGDDVLIVERTLFEANFAGGDGGGLWVEEDLDVFDSYFEDNESDNDGGGIYVLGDDDYTATVDRSSFINNIAGDDGGGLYVNDDDGDSDYDITINFSLFADNFADEDGGGVYVEDNAYLTNNFFVDNVADFGVGGGLFVDDALTAFITEFDNNFSDGPGGGAFVGEYVEIHDSLFEDNESGFGGGGLFVADGDADLFDTQFFDNEVFGGDGGGAFVAGFATVTDSRFGSNRTNGPGDGGGLYVDFDAVLANTYFINNAARDGGGAYVTGQVTVSDSYFEANNSRAAAFEGGGGLNALTADIADTIFFNNRAAVDGGGLFVVADTNIRGGSFEDNFTVDGDGGAINGGNVTLSDVVIDNNDAFNIGPGGGAGGGVYAVNLTTADTTIVNNDSSRSGGGAFVELEADLTDTLFEQNTSNGGVGGGGLRVNSLVDIHNTDFVGNTANFGNIGGGGVLVVGNGPGVGTATLVGGRFIDNVANHGGSGGGLAMAGPLGGSTHVFTADGTEFTSNTANIHGGGVHILGGVTVSLVDSTFTDNTTNTANGGGMHVEVNANGVGGNLELVDTDFTGNTSDGAGGGAYVRYDAQISGGTFNGNAANRGGGGGLRVATLVMTDTVFANNTANVGGSGPIGGGGVFLTNNNGDPTLGTATLVGGSFTNNSTNLSGGGLAAGDNGSATTIYNVTATGTTFNNNTADLFGGGLAVPGTITLTDVSVIENTSVSLSGGGASAYDAIVTTSYFEGNIADVDGGGLAISDTLMMVDTDFISNTATTGVGGGAAAGLSADVNGGLFERNTAGSDGGGLFALDLTLRDVEFTDNTGARGGGAAVYGPADVDNSLFEGNSATAQSGGGLRVDQLVITDSTFINNTTVEDGGGIYLRVAGVGDGSLQLTNTEFFANNATNNGGGVAFYGTDARLVNGVFNRNTATASAALYLGGSGTADVIHNSIADVTTNAADAIGVASGTVTIINTIVASHTTGIAQTGGTVTEDYNLFYNNGTDLSGTITSGGNSFNATPAFKDIANDDLDILFGSAAIDAGVNAGVDFDFNYDQRPGFGSTLYDIGAFEKAGITNDLILTKMATPTVFAGETITYTISLLNNGFGTARNVAISDTLPAGVTFSNVTTYTDGVCGHDGVVPGVVTCTLPILLSSNTVSFTIVVTSDSDLEAGTSLENTAVVTSTLPEGNVLNNIAKADTSIIGMADLQLTKAGPVTVTAGTEITYTVVVSNNGPSTAQFVDVKDELPNGVSLVSAEVTTRTGSALTSCVSGICQVGDMAAGETITLTIVGLVDSSVADGEVLTNTATVFTVTFDDDETNNTDTVTTAVEVEADLHITKLGSLTVTAGTDLEYRLVVTNAGPSDAVDVVVTDPLPVGVTYNGSFTSLGGSCSEAGGNITCNLGTVEAGAAPIIVTIQAGVISSLTDTITNTAYVSSTTEQDSPVWSNVVTTVIESGADLELVKTATPTGIAGQTISYTLSVINNGPSDAEGVVVVDQLPDEVTLSSLTSSVSPVSYAITANNDVVITYTGRLTAGVAIDFTLVVTVDEDVEPGTSLENVAGVSGGTNDPNLANNESRADTSIIGGADLEIAKSGDVTVVAGGLINYEVVVTNNGPSVAQDVEVDDVLPQGVSPISAQIERSGGGTSTCNVENCVLDDVAVSEVVTITIVGLVDASLTDGTVLTNTATVSSDTSDSVPDNNTDTHITTVEAQAGLLVFKTGSFTATAGGSLSYNILVANNGPSDATDVVVTDTLDSRLENIIGYGLTVTPTLVNCSVASNVLTCNLDTVPAGSVAQVAINADVASSASGVVSNQAIADSPDDFDGGSSNNWLTVIEQVADLGLVKLATPTTNAGGPITYTLVVHNSGPSDATIVQVVDTLPVEVAFNTAPGCIEAGGVVTCSTPTLTAGGSITFTILVTANNDLPSGYSIENGATVSSLTSDNNQDNNSANADTSIVGVADLELTKTGDVTATAGGQIEYTVTVVNNGPSAAQAVDVKDTLPPEITLDTATIERTGSGPTACGGTVCQVGDMALGETVTITLLGTVDPGVTNGTVLTNSATVFAYSTDPIPGNNTDTHATTIETEADLSITKVDLEDPVQPTEGFIYEIVVTNDGPSDASNVVITDTLGSNLEFAAASFGCTGSSGSSVITCTVDTLAADSSVRFLLAVIAGDVPDGTVLTNTVEVDSDTFDPNTANNSDVEDTIVRQQFGPSADLSITKQANPTTVNAGETVTYTLVVTNNGPATATNAQVLEFIPAGTRLIDVNVDNPDFSYEFCTLSGICYLGTISPTTVATVTTVLEIDPDFSDSNITNLASVAADQIDHFPNNNIDGSTITVTTSADLSIAKADLSDPVFAGETLMYQLRITNAGPSIANNVLITDTLPLSTTYIGASDFCYGFYGLGSVVTCTLSSLDVGQMQSAFIQVRIDDGILDSTIITNTAYVSSDTADPNAGNNSTTEDTAVFQSVFNPTDLEIAKFAVPDPTVIAGQLITYTLVVTNNGPAPATSVQVADIIPLGTTFVDVASSQGICQTGIVCDLGDIAVGSSAEVIMVVRVNSDRLTPVVNVASVSAFSPEIDPPDTDDYNNRAEVTTLVDTEADLVISKIALPSAVTPGGNANYLITVFNRGSSDARNVLVTDTIPTELTGVVYGISQGNCANNVCSLGTLPAGDSATISIGATVVPSTTAAFTNTVVVGSSTFDPDTSNNQAEAGVIVNVNADLSLRKRATPTAFTGGTIVYTLTVTHQGPSDAQNVQVVDTLPNGVTFASAGAGCSYLGGNVVTCTTATLAAGTAITYNIVVTVDNNVLPGVSLENKAVVSSDTPDDDPANNGADADTNILQIAALEITKTGPDEAFAGQTIEYTIVVTNSGPFFWSQAVDVVDTLPASVTFGSATMSINGGVEQPCTGTVCQVGDMAVNDVVNITVIATIDPTVIIGTVLTNTATISSSTANSNLIGNSDIHTTTIISQAGGIYLPIIFGPPGGGLPDLVGSISLIPGNPGSSTDPVIVEITVTNQGGTTSGPFWVDYYINPTAAPTAPNVPWQTTCTLTPCYGVAWSVQAGLAPGASVTLTSDYETPVTGSNPNGSVDPNNTPVDGGGYNASQTFWNGNFAPGTTNTYTFVDSWNKDVSYGSVLESNENNNSDSRGGLSVTGLGGVEIDASAMPNFPPRPVLTK